MNVRVGGKKSAHQANRRAGSAPGSVLWHGVELDDLSGVIESVATDGAQVVSLLMSTQAGGACTWGVCNRLPTAPPIPCVQLGLQLYTRKRVVTPFPGNKCPPPKCTPLSGRKCTPFSLRNVPGDTYSIFYCTSV